MESLPGSEPALGSGSFTPANLGTPTMVNAAPTTPSFGSDTGALTSSTPLAEQTGTLGPSPDPNNLPPEALDPEPLKCQTCAGKKKKQEEDKGIHFVGGQIGGTYQSGTNSYGAGLAMDKDGNLYGTVTTGKGLPSSTGVSGDAQAVFANGNNGLTDVVGGRSYNASTGGVVYGVGGASGYVNDSGFAAGVQLAKPGVGAGITNTEIVPLGNPVQATSNAVSGAVDATKEAAGNAVDNVTNSVVDSATDYAKGVAADAANSVVDGFYNMFTPHF